MGTDNKKYVTDSKRKIAAAVLLGVFCWYVGNVCFNVHSHRVGNAIVTHAHPYSGSPDTPGHTHSASGLITIAYLSLLLAAGLVLGLFRALLFGKPLLRILRQEKWPHNLLNSHIPLRGPPQSA